MPAAATTTCALCGLACDGRFCCPGCLNVYTILVESGAVPEGGDFRDTELYRRSLELGLVSNPEGGAATVPPAAETREAMFHVSGMWCNSCAWLIERAVRSERGVVSAEVIFASDLLKVRYCPQYLPPARIAERVARLGYSASEYAGPGGGRDRVRTGLLLRLGVAAFLWLNVMTLSAVNYVGYFEPVAEGARRLVSFVLMALSAPAVFYSAWPVLRLAWLGLRERMVRMEALLALGILAAFAYSSYSVFTGGDHVYFDTACAIVTFVLAGKLLEHGAKQKTAQALAFLHRMMPGKVRLVDGTRERFVAVDALQPGDAFLVKAGERIPADGVVEEGSSHVDESVLSGESAPVSKRPGDRVAGGSLNTGGPLRLRATRVSAESAIGQIIRAVEAALGSRSAIERTVDRVSRAFVPLVIAVAALTFAGWAVATGEAGPALIRAITVLVIACPCALGIATPLALTAAVGAASRRGILVNDVQVLETIRKVDVVVLDKTGTVTEGDFCLLDAAGGEPEWLVLIGSLETCSEHPIGRAVVRRAREDGVSLDTPAGVEIRKGMGITGRVRHRDVFAGNRRLIEDLGLAPEAGLDGKARAWERDGLSTAFFGWDGHVAGALAFGDRIRADAAALVRDLAARGIETMLVSGDALATTASVAGALGMGTFRAEALPAEKSEVIRGLRDQGRVVAMVGDGVNDAPALAEANLGIALGSGTDLAMSAAPIVLVGNSLGRIPEAFDLARFAFRIVRQNLFWAFVYNTAGISLAVGGVLTPILAAGSMALSSLSVIANSLRLRRE